ncbi:TPA: hypothetical protein PTV43_003985 [Clostridium botulinum]|nr:hypothetical protein [Clostridium botulinum]HDK7158744.1 hypothetical protein [Clostridium botulinum]
MDIKEILKTDNSKLNFMKGLIRLSKIDGNVSDEEKLFFTQAAMQLKMTNESISLLENYWYTTDKIEVFFKTKMESLFFIREAIQLCAVDGSYDDNEKKEIRVLGKELKLLDTSIDEIENWVEDGLKWQALGDRMITIEK